MIKSFKHKGLEKFFCNADACGIQTQMAARIDRMLDAIDQAQDVNELALPGWYLHPLKGDKKHLYSMRVSGNWRITFEFRKGDATMLNLEDYH